eukprot:SAG11_NODE_206_length_12389_cov_11.831192_11_plen_234_part_00
MVIRSTSVSEVHPQYTDALEAIRSAAAARRKLSLHFCAAESALLLRAILRSEGARMPPTVAGSGSETGLWVCCTMVGSRLIPNSGAPYTAYVLRVRLTQNDVELLSLGNDQAESGVESFEVLKRFSDFEQLHESWVAPTSECQASAFGWFPLTAAVACIDFLCGGCAVARAAPLVLPPKAVGGVGGVAASLTAGFLQLAGSSVASGASGKNDRQLVTQRVRLFLIQVKENFPQ